MSSNKFRTEEVINALRELRDDLPLRIAKQAKNFFLNNFRLQGFLDANVQPWANVKRRIPGTNAYKYPKTKDLGRHDRAILQGKGSGMLRKAVNNSIRETTYSLIRLNVEVPYASYLNDGTSKMPARKFIGHSVALQEKQIKLITSAIDKAFKS